MKQEILTILLGMSPILEVRGAIPVAIGIFKFMPAKAYALSVLGNLIPVLPALFTWYYLSNYLMKKSYWLNRLFAWLFNYTREKHQNRFNYHHHRHIRSALEFLALFIFVAIPFPLTGMWSGTIAAFVFGVPIWRAAAAIGLGVLTSGAIVLLVLKGIIALPFF